MSFEVMAPLMFVGLVLFLLLGYPVAFSLGAVGLLFGWIGVQYDFIQPVFLQNIPLRIFDTLKNQTLLAIPFFTFMGLILERSGMAEELLDTVGQLFGRLRGGVAFAVILVGAVLAATTGVVAASVIAMGLISLPVMLRHGYSPRVASGVIAASGTLAQIIPPSLVLIIMADQLGVSVGDMYRGAFVPGFILTGLYLGYVVLISLINPKAVPGLPEEARTHRGSALAWRVLTVMIPPLVLIFLVLGTIFLGVATPTEGGAMGAVGALILALARRRLSLKVLIQAMEATARLTSFVTFILVGSRIFSLVFVGVDGDRWVENLLETALPDNPIAFLLIINLIVFLIAFFLDFFEIAFIIIPLILPAVTGIMEGLYPEDYKIGLYWFGVMLGVNLQTSFMHPPFGFALFYLRSVAPPSLKTSDIYWGAVPFVVIQVIMVLIVLFNPWLVTNWLAK
ncbi:TRAP transporter large permease [Calidithermus roseus]|uniref:C4-dicarboxylate TRAP transporter large permease protein DctM n=1 Tax=Calidithermus roseus TaxID=1644118 RepID=A0A399ESN5_9DEIN|nr:TRAP transporter large permease subunit [Calidithermus roseus]RIH86059.1 C4-dicarboxylate TRAP transporter large permease protein DctM [Calidithermus roseus]